MSGVSSITLRTVVVCAWASIEDPSDTSQTFLWLNSCVLGRAAFFMCFLDANASGAGPKHLVFSLATATLFLARGIRKMRVGACDSADPIRTLVVLVGVLAVSRVVTYRTRPRVALFASAAQHLSQSLICQSEAGDATIALGS